MNEELQAGPLAFVLFTVMLLGEEHAGEDEGGAEDEVFTFAGLSHDSFHSSA